MREKIRQIVLGRSYLTVIMFILQLLFYVIVANVLIQYSIIIQVIAYILSLLLTIYILSMKNTDIYSKALLVIVIIIFPVFGTCMFFFFRNQRVRKKIRLNLESQEYATKKINHDSEKTDKALEKQDKSVFNMSRYILKTTNMPIYNNTSSK